MLIRPKKLPIDPAQPFTSDKLDRLKSAVMLTQLIDRVDTPFVLGLNAMWGDGKTTFVEMWRHHLCTAQIRCLYFNAWESDYADDPLISFIGEMGAQLEGSGKLTRLSETWKQVKEKGALLAKRLVPVVLKVGTAGVLDLDSFTEQSLASAAADLAKEKIEHYAANKNTVKEFKARLAAFVKELSEQGEGGKRPVVFFGDELDRCRPTYAVELLERIKHFFEVEGLIFVLSLDKDQLGHSIRAVYGAGINVEGYLRRFIDLEFQLPKVSGINFLHYQAEQYQLQEVLKRIGRAGQIPMIEAGINVFEGLAATFRMSLRAQEQCFATLSIALLTSPLDLYLPFLTWMVVLRAGNWKLYDGLVTSNISVKELVETVESTPNGKQFLASDAGLFFEAEIIGWKKGSDPTADHRVAMYTNISNEQQGKHPSAPRAHRILTHLQAPFNFRAVAESYVRAIEITGQFKSPPAAPSNLKVE